jgi:hypothetical protein
MAAVALHKTDPQKKKKNAKKKAKKKSAACAVPLSRSGQPMPI